jgi:hypothetical protein
MTILKCVFEEENEPDIGDIFWTIYIIFSLCLSPLTVCLLICLLRGDLFL